MRCRQLFRFVPDDDPNDLIMEIRSGIMYLLNQPDNMKSIFSCKGCYILFTSEKRI